MEYLNSVKDNNIYINNLIYLKLYVALLPSILFISDSDKRP